MATPPAGNDERVAVLYQAAKPPVREGLAKPMKPGGYSDGGADIAFALRHSGVEVLTPASEPHPTRPLDWVFADDRPGIDRAIAQGATVLWANTTLFAGHPLEALAAQPSRPRIVGQIPAEMELVDDKYATNRRLRAVGLPVACSVLVAEHPADGTLSLERLTEDALRQRGLELPLMLKPVRGRGSQGVVLVSSLDDLRASAHRMLGETETIASQSSPLYGSVFMLEEYLSGEEITLTILPPGAYRLPSGPRGFAEPWALPPVRRTGHRQEVLPYNGLVPVSENSVAIPPDERLLPAFEAVTQACVRAAQLVAARAPVRIDCRRAASGTPYLLFDFNMKPSLTGSGRPGRDAQDSLTGIAARALGWSYSDLLRNMLAQSW